MKRSFVSDTLAPDILSDQPTDKKHKKKTTEEAGSMPGTQSDSNMDDDEDGPPATYNVETSNRFTMLPIPVPERTSLRVPATPKPKTPPTFFIFESPEIIKSKVPKAVIQNGNNCTMLLPNSVEEHLKLCAVFKQWGWKYHTQNPEPLQYKRFVLHGLNTHPLDDLYEDLEKYGLRPALITTIPVKRPRYNDQSVYVVHYEKASDITMDIIKQAKYIRNTVARWMPYIQNGDGVTVCSRCSTPGHTAKWCNRPPRCKVCSEGHLTNDCPLIIAKRAANLNAIHISNLKCPLCGDKHTATYRQCTGRLEYRNNKISRQQQKRKYINASPPARNAWTGLVQTDFPPINQRRRIIYDDQNHQPTPVFNHPNYNVTEFSTQQGPATIS